MNLIELKQGNAKVCINLDHVSYFNDQENKITLLNGSEIQVDRESIINLRNYLVNSEKYSDEDLNISLGNERIS